MPSTQSRAERYRSQAVDLRRMAAHSTNARMKAEYLKLAQEYEVLAREVEAFDAKRR
ncbi:MAG TPA: hypothetical protein VGB82_27395 [Alphaproteobacteria bacterium]